jgi:hypothetical protein
MNLKLEIRRNHDGAVTSLVWPDWNFNIFWWENGNGSCDCNREDFFLQGQEDADDLESKCGHGRYAVRCSNADTTAVLYDEFLQSAS